MLSILGLAASTSCGPYALNNRQHLTQQTASQYAGYRTHVVEFDDDGYLRDTVQFNQAIGAMHAAAQAGRVITIVFIHGWKHDARPNDSNLRAFDALAVRLEGDLKQRALTSGEPPTRLVSIYLGWRGESSTGPKWWNLWLPGWFWQQLTFWDRKAGAERVGRGEMQVVLSRISDVWRTWRTGSDSTASNMLVLAGHSFGGAALLNATIPWLVTGSEGRGTLENDGVADLIVALNPAVQASILDKTVLSNRLNLVADGSDRTRLLVLDANNDGARKWLFPVGTTLANPIGSSESWRAWIAERQAAGRPGWQQRYVLGTVKGRADGSVGEPCREYPLQNPAVRLWLKGTPLLKCSLNSVMVVQARNNVIEGHNGIWNPLIMDFLRGYIVDQQEVTMQFVKKLLAP